MHMENEVEPAEEILDRIMQQYAVEPHGWHVISTPTGDMLVLGPRSSFQLKLITLGPTEFTGVGVELASSPKSISPIRSAPSFGLRALSTGDLDHLVRAIHGDSESIGEAKSILERRPLSPSEIEQKNIDHILSGPIFTRPDLDSLDSTISSLKQKLTSSAQDRFRKKYPLRSGMFF